MIVTLDWSAIVQALLVAVLLGGGKMTLDRLKAIESKLVRHGEKLIRIETSLGIKEPLDGDT